MHILGLKLYIPRYFCNCMLRSLAFVLHCLCQVWPDHFLKNLSSQLICSFTFSTMTDCFTFKYTVYITQHSHYEQKNIIIFYK